MPAGVRVADRQQLPLLVVVIVGDMAVRVGRFGDIALGIALIFPHRFTAIARVQETVAVLVGRRFVFRRNQRDQPSDFVVAVFGDGAERILLGNQPTFIVVGLEVFATIQLDLAHQPRPVVVDVNLFAAVGVFNQHTAVVVPDITRVHLRKRRPMPHAPGRFAGPFPLPEETRPTGQLPLQNHVLLVVVVAFAFTGGIGRFDQAMASVVAVGNQRLLGTPGVFQGLGRMKTLILDGDDVPALVAQQQGTTCAVIEALNAVQKVARACQSIAIGIADGRQTSCTKVEKPRFFASQGEDQFFRLVTEINRCPRQAVVNRRALDIR